MIDSFQKTGNIYLSIYLSIYVSIYLSLSISISISIYIYIHRISMPHSFPATPQHGFPPSNPAPGCRSSARPRPWPAASAAGLQPPTAAARRSGERFSCPLRRHGRDLVDKRCWGWGVMQIDWGYIFYIYMHRYVKDNDQCSDYSERRLRIYI